MTFEMGPATQDINQSGNTQHDPDDEKTPFTKEEVIGNDVQIVKNGVGGTDNSVPTTTDKQAGILTQLRNDSVYREKFLIYLGIFWSFFVLGWTIGQFGPSFLDLRIITNTPLRKASGFMTGHSVGYLVGSIIAGIIFDKMTGERTYCVSISVLAVGVVVAVIPWCSIYELMVGIHVLKGIVGGGLDTTGNALLLRLWGANGKSFMQSIHFAFAIGGTISPFVTAPFLAPDESPPTGVPGNTNITNSSSGSNLTQWNTTTTLEESMLYVPFSIASFLALTASIPLFVMACTSKRPPDTKPKDDEDQDVDKERNIQKLSLGMKVLVMVILMVFLGLDCAMEDGFNSFLATFCVNELKWTKYVASVATALFWASFTGGRFLGIFLANVFKAIKLIFILCTLLFFGFLGFFLTAHFKIYEGIWISTALVGSSMSMIFPLIFSWTEESILPVTGFVSSLFLIAASAGSMVNPIILGYLMDKSTSMWFAYIMLGESVLFIMILFLVWTIASRIKLPKNTFREVEIEIRSENVDDLELRSIIAESEVHEDRL